ncbi:MAG: IS1595 family transposase, partial [Alphaproteobacteria bacterium]|nr:IS1595 family transposase [Alphaproteobacteria bacterium]
MRSDAFERMVGLLSDLTVEQREKLRDALATGDRQAAVVTLLEQRLGTEPACVHCGAERAGRWGLDHGLRRFRCRTCKRSFNALTGTPLARLRKKAAWLAFAEALSDGTTVAAAAERCGVAPSTSFRWRHRFLRAKTAESEVLGGIVEADETFFRLSFKGSRRWQGGAEPAPERPPKKRGTRAQKRGLSHEQVAVLVARDRSGATRACVCKTAAPRRSTRPSARLSPRTVSSAATPGVPSAWSRANTAFATSRSISTPASGCGRKPG